MRWIIFLILFSIPFVSGFGVSSEHHKSNPLYLDAGSEKTTKIKIYNTLSDNPSEIEIRILEGEEIARINTNILEIPAGEFAEIDLQVSIPEQGTEVEEIKILFKSLSVENLEGNVQFSPSFINSFEIITDKIDFEVISNESEDGFIFTIFYSVLIFLILGIMILIILYIKRNRRVNETQF